MKKVILFFSVMFLSGMIAFGQPTATLSLPDMGGGIPAGTVTTPLTIDALGGGDNLGTFQIFIVYDPLVVTPTAVNFTNPMLPFYEWQNNLAYGPNEIILTWLSFAGGYIPTPIEELCTIEWTYVGDPAYTDLMFNTVGEEVAGWPEKGQTLIWSTFGTEYVTTLIDGSIGPDGPDFSTWIGMGADDYWSTPENWDEGGVPVAGWDAVIPAGTPHDPFVYFGGECENLTVDAGATVTVDYLAGLTTYGMFTCEGDFYVVTEDASGYAGSYIDMGGLAGGGMFYFTRNMFCTGIGGASSDPLGWHYLAAPIDGFTTDDMVDYYINEWDATAAMWNQFAGTEPCVPAATETLDVLEAWSVNYATDWACPGGTGMDLEFMGPVTGMHTGPYGAGAVMGWNMFANPYPSGLNMNAIAWDPGAQPGAAYYDGCAGNYWYWTPALGDYFMSPGLGFFTEYTAPGTFDLAGTERAHVGDFFWKSDDLSYLLTLEITNGEKSDITHIRFMEEAEAGFAKDGDFHKLFSTEVPQIYTTAGEDMLAVNVLPETASVDMGLTSEVSGSYTISAIETSEFAHVVLEDKVTGIQTDLLADSYTFEYTVEEDADRFIVHFTPLGIGDNFADMVNIWSSANNIYVQAPDVTGDIVVFNMMGQEVVRTGIETGTTVIPMSDVNTYYVVKVLTNDNAVTGKVFIK